MTDHSRWLQLFLRQLYIFGEILDKYRNHMVIIWFVLLIILGLVYKYGTRQIENQRLESGRPGDARPIR